MKILKHSWIILVTLVAGFDMAIAETIIEDATPQQISVDDVHSIEMRSVEIPAFVASRLAAQNVKVGHHDVGVLQVKTIQLRGDHVVVVGQRLVSKWVKQQRSPSLWLQEVRVTFPRVHLANSWDVQALQRELERLGIKIKPKPSVPRPTPQLSG